MCGCGVGACVGDDVSKVVWADVYVGEGYVWLRVWVGLCECA